MFGGEGLPVPLRFIIPAACASMVIWLPAITGSGDFKVSTARFDCEELLSDWTPHTDEEVEAMRDRRRADLADDAEPDPEEADYMVVHHKVKACAAAAS